MRRFTNTCRGGSAMWETQRQAQPESGMKVVWKKNQENVGLVTTIVFAFY